MRHERPTRHLGTDPEGINPGKQRCQGASAQAGVKTKVSGCENKGGENKGVRNRFWVKTKVSWVKTKVSGTVFVKVSGTDFCVFWAFHGDQGMGTKGKGMGTKGTQHFFGDRVCFGNEIAIQRRVSSRRMVGN